MDWQRAEWSPFYDAADHTWGNLYDFVSSIQEGAPHRLLEAVASETDASALQTLAIRLDEFNHGVTSGQMSPQQFQDCLGHLAYWFQANDRRDWRGMVNELAVSFFWFPDSLRTILLSYPENGKLLPTSARSNVIADACMESQESQSPLSANHLVANGVPSDSSSMKATHEKPSAAAMTRVHRVKGNDNQFEAVAASTDDALALIDKVHEGERVNDDNRLSKERENDDNRHANKMEEIEKQSSLRSIEMEKQFSLRSSEMEKQSSLKQEELRLQIELERVKAGMRIGPEPASAFAGEDMDATAPVMIAPTPTNRKCARKTAATPSTARKTPRATNVKPAPSTPRRQPACKHTITEPRTPGVNKRKTSQLATWLRDIPMPSDGYHGWKTIHAFRRPVPQKLSIKGRLPSKHN